MKLVRRQLRIDAPPSVVYRFLVDEQRFVQWMAVDATLEPVPGGEISWTHANGDRCRGRFVELVPDRRVVFTYGWERPDVAIAPGSTTVVIELHHEPGGATRLELTHLGLDDVAAELHDGGWRHYLGRLESAATGRPPGPDPLAGERLASARRRRRRHPAPGSAGDGDAG